MICMPNWLGVAVIWKKTYIFPPRCVLTRLKSCSIKRAELLKGVRLDANAHLIGIKRLRQATGAAFLSSNTTGSIFTISFRSRASAASRLAGLLASRLSALFLPRLRSSWIMVFFTYILSISLQEPPLELSKPLRLFGSGGRPSIQAIPPSEPFVDLPFIVLGAAKPVKVNIRTEVDWWALESPSRPERTEVSHTEHSEQQPRLSLPRAADDATSSWWETGSCISGLLNKIRAFLLNVSSKIICVGWKLNMHLFTMKSVYYTPFSPKQYINQTKICLSDKKKPFSHSWSFTPF